MTNSERYKEAFDSIISNDFVKIDKDEIINHKGRNKGLMVAAIFLAIFSVAGGTVYAAQKYYGLFDYLKEYGINADNENDMTDKVMVIEDDIISIDEVYIDGMILCFKAHFTKDNMAGKIDLGDHVKIDGEDKLLYSFDYVGDGEYMGIIQLVMNTFQEHQNDDLMDINPGDNVNIELSVIDVETDARTACSFCVAVSDEYRPARIIPEQTIKLTDGIEVSVKKSYISSSKIFLQMSFTGKTEQNQKIYDTYTNENIYDDWTEYYVEDDKGNRKALEFSGSMGTDWSIDIDGFNTDSDYIKFIPYKVSVDSGNGKLNYEDSELMEDYSFIIYLKNNQ